MTKRDQGSWKKDLLLLFSRKTKTTPLPPANQKNVFFLFLQNLAISIMTAWMQKILKLQEVLMKIFKSSILPGNYGLRDLF